MTIPDRPSETPPLTGNDLVLARLRARLETAAMGDGEAPRYQATAGRLDDIRDRHASADWLEARILLNALHRKRSAQTVNFLGTLRKRCDDADDLARFTAFHSRVAAMLHPLSITSHGYSLPLGQYDADDVWSVVASRIQAVAALDHKLFLNSGTLLGAVRDGGFIAHDDDLDLALVLHAGSAEAAAAEWLALRQSLMQADLIMAEDQKGRVPEIIKLRPIGAIEIDVFPCWIENGRAFVYPHTYGELAEDDVLPLAPGFLGRFNLPKEPEKMLMVNYGPGWRKPDPLWGFNWAAAHARFAAFRAGVAKAGPEPHKKPHTDTEDRN